MCVCIMYVCTGQFILTLPISSNPTPACCYLWKQPAGTRSRLRVGCVTYFIKFHPYVPAVNLGYVQERNYKFALSSAGV